MESLGSDARGLFFFKFFIVMHKKVASGLLQAPPSKC